MRKKVEFRTEKAEYVELERNGFIEIARKTAVSEDGENLFVSISRGFVLPDGQKRYLKSFSIPADPEKVRKISEFLAGILE